MYLLDNSYFKNKLEIEGIFNSESGVADKLDEYSTIYEVEFLQKLFGAVDFEDLNSNVENGALKTDAPQRWKDFVNGETYTYNGENFVWNGLLYTIGSVKRSILANVVFCKIIADLETNNGRFVIDAKASIRNVMRSHYVQVWNEIADEFNYNLDRVPVNAYYHHGVPIYDYYGGQKGKGYVTMSQYLTHRKDIFQNTDLCLYPTINSFDL
jgi:hypothetical protein